MSYNFRAMRCNKNLFEFQKQIRNNLTVGDFNNYLDGSFVASDWENKVLHGLAGCAAGTAGYNVFADNFSVIGCSTLIL